VFRADGKLAAQDSQGNVAVTLASVTLAHWVRIEVHMDVNDLTVQLYNSPNSATITETVTLPHQSLDPDGIDRIVFMSGPDEFWFDEPAASTATWLGRSASVVEGIGVAS